MLTSMLSALVTLAVGASAATIALPGFVTTKGSRFILNGKNFVSGSANCYWCSFQTNDNDTNIALTKAKAVGHEVLRAWFFNERNVTFNPNGLPKYSEDSNAIYLQSWDNGKPTINYGENGLKHFDKLVKLAEQKGIKLIAALTNNWADYGGMDVYTVNLGGQYHDDFFSSPKIKAAFKNYIKAVVSRYKHSPAIFAWELGNEPRCGADGSRNLPRSPTGCTPAVTTAWAKEISSFIKSIDPYHLVTVGDEGFFAEEGNEDWAYNGADGTDTEAFLRLKTIDFGTFHAYPDWWSKDPLTWAPEWIKAHGALQRRVNKPVIFEEYGWMTPEARLATLGSVSNVTRLEAIGLWQRTSIAEKLPIDMYWQFGVDNLSYGLSTNDGFTIFSSNQTEAGPLIYEHVKAVKRILG